MHHNTSKLNNVYVFNETEYFVYRNVLLHHSSQRDSLMSTVY